MHKNSLFSATRRGTLYHSFFISYLCGRSYGRSYVHPSA